MDLAHALLEIDEIPVEREEAPSSADELSRVLKHASETATPLVPVGGGTKLHLGNPPRSARLAVRTGRLRGIVEYEPDNMTVSALSGTPLQELQDVLREKGQFLPLDAPRPAEATIGGLVACNTSGPIRFRYGTIRDFLIGVKIVHADGVRTKAGGKLVKNVTGYDMCKLYTGSLGTLGILSELTFKVQPRQEAAASVILSYPSPQSALEATQAFLRAELLPDAMELWNAPALEGITDEPMPAAWILMIGLSEVIPAVRWQVSRLKEVLAATGGTLLRELDSVDSESWWQRAASAREISLEGEEAAVKCSVMYQSTAETVLRMEEMGGRLGARLRIYCHAGSYVVYGRYQWATAGPTPETLRGELETLRAYCAARAGHMVVERVRPAVKAGFDVWGYDAPALEIMRRIKQQFDPKGILNPGRFVGGI